MWRVQPLGFLPRFAPRIELWLAGAGFSLLLFLATREKKG